MNSQIYSHWKQLVVRVMKTEDQQFQRDSRCRYQKGKYDEYSQTEWEIVLHLMLINCDVLIGYSLINIGGSSVFIGSAYVAGLPIVIFDKVSNRLANIGLTFFPQSDLEQNSTRLVCICPISRPLIW